MTENEAIERIKDHMEIHKLNEPRVIYITVALSMAITVLKEIYQYREIGTVEECREAVKFKEYFDELYGTGLEVANWHLNGDLISFDSFYSGKTANKVEKFVNSRLGTIKCKYVFYDGSKERHDDVVSLYRYYK